jgi:LysM repeat protein
MKPKPETLEKSDRGFDSQTFWRHYVATVDTDHEWDEERPQQGRGSNRLFLFLLLFHIFLIGSVVLYNLVSERPKPVFVDNSSPQKIASAKKSPAPATPATGSNVTTANKQIETVEHRVAQGDSLKTIADAAGATQDEVARLNHIDVNTQLAVGSVLRVPKLKAKSSSPVIPLGGQPSPSHADAKIASVQATTAQTTTTMFAAVTPASSPRKAETVASKLPEEKSKSKVEDSPPPALKPKVTAKVEDSPPPALKPKVTAKVEESPPAAKPKPPEKVEEAPPAAKPKPTEAKAITRPEAPPAHTAKASDTSKPKSETTKPTTAASTSKPAASGATHTVKPKETFYSISRKLGVKVEDLMRLNGVTDPGKLREGMVLKVPAKG